MTSWMTVTSPTAQSVRQDAVLLVAGGHGAAHDVVIVIHDVVYDVDRDLVDDIAASQLC